MPLRGETISSETVNCPRSWRPTSRCVSGTAPPARNDPWRRTSSRLPCHRFIIDGRAPVLPQDIALLPPQLRYSLRHPRQLVEQQEWRRWRWSRLSHSLEAHDQSSTTATLVNQGVTCTDCHFVTRLQHSERRSRASLSTSILPLAWTRAPAHLMLPASPVHHSQLAARLP